MQELYYNHYFEVDNGELIQEKFAFSDLHTAHGYMPDVAKIHEKCIWGNSTAHQSAELKSMKDAP